MDLEPDIDSHAGYVERQGIYDYDSISEGEYLDELYMADDEGERRDMVERERRAENRQEKKKKQKPRGETCTCKCKWYKCRKEFEARVADRKRGWARFCSKSCAAKFRTKNG